MHTNSLNQYSLLISVYRYAQQSPFLLNQLSDVIKPIMNMLNVIGETCDNILDHVTLHLTKNLNTGLTSRELH